MEGNRTEKQRTGAKGEAIACRFLEQQGWTIAAKNYRTPFGEIDIIARRKNILSFAEVKTRRSAAFGWPCQAVNAKKQRRLWLSAQYYLKSCPGAAGLALQMDILEVLLLDNGTYVRHIENAFSCSK